jgi:DNA segregation ATPase FtsK/SpoIIIE-like protein
MVEEMERLGIVGPQNGSKPRDVISSGSGVA